LLEEFCDEGVFDYLPVSYLESLGIPVTGSGSRGLRKHGRIPMKANLSAFCEMTWHDEATRTNDIEIN
jgi:hypothetical protein